MNLVRVLTMASESSKCTESVAGEPVVDLFTVEAALDPGKLLRVSSLSEVNLVLEKAKFLPTQRTLVTNVVSVTRGDVTGIQLMLLDPQLPPRISCAAKVLFPKAPESVKMTLTKRYAEFGFRPNSMVSDWIDAGKLDLQVIEVF